MCQDFEKKPRLHICNTFFEKELETKKNLPLHHWIHSHPMVQALQTTPLLYADKEDRILSFHQPLTNDPRWISIDEDLSSYQIEDWGASKAIEEFALKKKIAYRSFNWNLIQTLQSKLFAFTQFPKLASSEALFSKEEILHWIEKTKGPKVLKTFFGTAGKGHFHIEKDRNLESFIEKELTKGQGLVAEPWVQRVLDFSSQWNEGKLIGLTLCKTSEKGRYLSSIVGNYQNWLEKFQKHIDEHLAIVTPFVEKLFHQGFQSHLGIDAFIYQEEGKEKLKAVAEINARKTMGWATLQIEQKKYRNQTIALEIFPLQKEKGSLKSLFYVKVI